MPIHAAHVHVHVASYRVCIYLLQGEIEFYHSDWCRISSLAQDLVEALMEKDPKKRPTAQEVRGSDTYLPHMCVH